MLPGLRGRVPPASASTVGPTRTLPPNRPLVVAHRGASGYRPEHTLEAYRLGIELGADFIEPDLVLTADGVLVARHENEISATTDVAERPEFADRRTTKTVDGRRVTGWFTEDLTLAELRTLRARERLPRLRPGSRRYDGRWPVPTFDEVLELVERESARTGRVVGVCPELKHPSHFAAAGLSHDDALLAALRRHGWDSAAAPVFVQSFEPTSLRRLAERTSVRLAQLVAAEGRPYDATLAGDGRTYADLLTPAGLREVSTYAAVVAVHKSLVSLVVPSAWAPVTGRTHRLVEDAAWAGLAVHAWTFRNEDAFLPPRLRSGRGDAAWGDAATEYVTAAAAGVAAVFTDHPDTAVAALADVPLVSVR
jgi:glycerophosphoryl diester phosphodiesterase